MTKKFPCPYCKKENRDKKELQQHMKKCNKAILFLTIKGVSND